MKITRRDFIKDILYVSGLLALPAGSARGPAWQRSWGWFCWGVLVLFVLVIGGDLVYFSFEQHLQSDAPLQLRVVSLVDEPHPPSSQFSYYVVVGENFADDKIIGPSPIARPRFIN